jgi:hypothetical protein
MWLRDLDRDILAPHQREHLGLILRNRYSFRLGCRQQAGKSFTLAAAAVALASGHSGDPAHDVVILSKDDRTAGNLIREAAKHLSALDGYEPTTDPKLGSLQRLALRNGRFIQSFPGRPGALQGFTGSVLIDELSQIEAGVQDTLEQALSVSSRHRWFRVAMASNADFDGSDVHKITLSAARRGIAYMSTTIHDVYPDGLPAEIAAICEAMGGVDTLGWRRFFLNRFVARSDGLIAAVLLQRAASAPEVHVGSVVMAIDPGLSKHVTGFAVARIGDGRLHVLDSGHLTSIDDALIDEIEAIGGMHGAGKYVIDPGSVGYSVARDLRQRVGAVTGRSAGQPAQDRWSSAALRMLASGRMRIDPSQRDLIEDLAALQDQEGHLHAPIRPHDAPGRSIHCDAALALLSLMDEPGLAAEPDTEPRRPQSIGAAPLNRRITHAGNGNRHVATRRPIV